MSTFTLRARQLRAVVGKEGVEALRDRRALASALLYPLLGPVLVALLFAGMSRKVEQARQAPVPVVGASHAPALMAHLADAGVAVVGVDAADATDAVDSGRFDVVLTIPADHDAALAAGRPSRLQLDGDFSKPASARMAARVAGLVQAWSQSVLIERAVARGVHPGILAPVLIERRDHATAEQHAAGLLHMLPMFALLAAFVGAMQIAIDSTAGERERGSLEPTLLHPAPTWVFAGGKWVVATLTSLLAGALTLALTAATFPLLPADVLGLRIHLGVVDLGLLAAVLLPTAPLAGGLLLFAASFARSFKEAQTWLSMLLFLPMLPGVLGSVWELGDAPWMLPIPALGQHLLTLRVLRGEPIDAFALVAAGLGALALGLLAVWATARQLQREKVLFLGQ